MNTDILRIHMAMESKRWDLMVERLFEYLKESKPGKQAERYRTLTKKKTY